MMYIVLSDRSTFDGCDGSFVATLNDSGNNALVESNDYKHVGADGIVEEILISELIKAYRILNKM